MIILRLLAAFVSAVVWGPNLAIAYDPPQPNRHVQATLIKEGISTQEWILFDGIRKRSIEQVAYALEQGADPNKARDIVSKNPPLVTAIYQYSPSEDIVRLLVSKGADVNLKISDRPVKPADDTFRERIFAWTSNEAAISDRTPLHIAASISAPNIVKLLIDLGANIEAKDSRGETPLFKVSARNRGNAEILLSAGSQINAQDKNGNTVLRLQRFLLRYLESDRKMQQEMYVEWLMQKGAAE